MILMDRPLPIPCSSSIWRETDGHSGQMPKQGLATGVAAFAYVQGRLAFSWIEEPAGAETASPADHIIPGE